MIYKKTDSYELYHGQMQDELSSFEENSIDSIVTDPPYELNFMNKGWDNAGVSFQKETWEKCLRVLKPGGHLLAFGGTRTYHRIACAIEDAGFEIRDTIMWLYGSGFPKSMDISKSLDKHYEVQGEKIGERKFGKTSTGQNSGWHNNNVAVTGKQDVFAPATDLAKQWQGWGTALKPSFEPIIVARKPFKGSLVDNVVEYGVGGINIDECRVPLESTYEYKETNRKPRSEDTVFDNNHSGFKSENNSTASANPLGRFPANTILTYDDTDYEEVCGGFPDTKSEVRKPTGGIILNPRDGWNNNSMIDKTERGFNDEGSASRYFYCAKASKKDRDEGCGQIGIKNIHPTVKPTELMQYLVRLVTPKGSTILDPFTGSGSTGKAVMFENRERNANYKFIGIEMTEDYLPICEARINFGMTYVYNDDDVKQISNETVAVVKQEKVGLW